MSSSIELHTVGPATGGPTTTSAVESQVPITTSNAIQKRHYIIPVMFSFALLGGAGGGIGTGIAYHSATMGAGMSGTLFAAIGAAEALVFWMST